jgi:hypothetical protein
MNSPMDADTRHPSGEVTLVLTVSAIPLLEGLAVADFVDHLTNSRVDGEFVEVTTHAAVAHEVSLAAEAASASVDEGHGALVVKGHLERSF